VLARSTNPSSSTSEVSISVSSKSVSNGLRIPDRRGDGRIRRDSVDRNQRTFETVLGGEPLNQNRNGGGLIRLVGDLLLAENEAAGGGEGRDEVKRRLVDAAIMASTRGLAVDGHEIRRRIERQLRKLVRNEGECVVGGKQQCMAVRLGARDHLRADGGAGARAIEHDHRVRPLGRQSIRDLARHRIGRGAGRKGHDKAHRTGRKDLGENGNRLGEHDSHSHKIQRPQQDRALR